MTHECIQEEAIRKMDEKLDKITDGISDLKECQALTNQILVGIHSRFSLSITIAYEYQKPQKNLFSNV